MATVSPFMVFRDWLFDGDLNSPIPKPKYDSSGKEIVPDILKYNSPIKKKYVMKMFIRNGPLNYYLNEQFNNKYFWKIDRAEFLHFIKRCVFNFKITNYDLVYFRSVKDTKLYKSLIGYFPHLKSYELKHLCEVIENSNERESIYHTLGLEVPKKQKIKKRKSKRKKLSLKQLLDENFSIIR